MLSEVSAFPMIQPTLPTSVPALFPTAAAPAADAAAFGMALAAVFDRAVDTGGQTPAAPGKPLPPTHQPVKAVALAPQSVTPPVLPEALAAQPDTIELLPAVRTTQTATKPAKPLRPAVREPAEPTALPAATSSVAPPPPTIPLAAREPTLPNTATNTPKHRARAVHVTPDIAQTASVPLPVALRTSASSGTVATALATTSPASSSPGTIQPAPAAVVPCEASAAPEDLPRSAPPASPDPRTAAAPTNAYPPPLAEAPLLDQRPARDEHANADDERAKPQEAALAPAAPAAVVTAALPAAPEAPVVVPHARAERDTRPLQESGETVARFRPAPEPEPGHARAGDTPREAVEEQDLIPAPPPAQTPVALALPAEGAPLANDAPPPDPRPVIAAVAPVRVEAAVTAIVGQAIPSAFPTSPAPPLRTEALPARHDPKAVASPPTDASVPIAPHADQAITALPLSRPTHPQLGLATIVDAQPSRPTTPADVPRRASPPSVTPPIVTAGPAAATHAMPIVAEAIASPRAAQPAPAPAIAPVAPAEAITRPVASAPRGPQPRQPEPAAGPAHVTRGDTAEPVAASPAQPPAPAVTLPPVIAAGTTAPAFRLFAQAIHAARRDEDKPSPLAPIATVEAPLAPVAAAGPESAQLDLSDRRWPQAMVDRIEMLRDAAGAAADAADTSIRLLPDALGTIDVSVRQEGDTVHVRFAAEQAATRALLAEAQPRLAELAEARGLKLTQDAAASGGQERRAPAEPPRPIPGAPPSATRDDDTLTTTDRIA